MNSNLEEPVIKRLRPQQEGDDLCEMMSNNNENNIELDRLKGSQVEAKVSDAEDMGNEEDCNVKNSNGESSSSQNNDEDHEDRWVFPPDEDITDMLEEVQYNGTFPTVTERYFTSYYKIDVQQPEDDIQILIHSNRICMLTLAPSHLLLQKDKTITKVDFKL
ncbi:hypothetical protein KM043_004869 [Ampulex compressa]|nr:hypothetical protein KM043_004869 [Ampulex compressa]